MFHATTIVAVKRNGKVAVAGDGQVTFAQNTIIKKSAKKIRRLYKNKIVAGFAGSVADAFTLFEKFEGKLEEYHGNLQRAAVELAKEWRTDKILRRLEALMIVASSENFYIISGSGEVIEPDDGVSAIGSGGPLPWQRPALINTSMEAKDIVQEALTIASEICIYTNNQIIVEEL